MPVSSSVGSAALRSLQGSLVRRSRNLLPLTTLWRSQKTEASPLESRETVDVPTNLENKEYAVRPFEEIPGPKAGLKSIVDFYTKTEGFTKGFKLTDRRFDEYGPIFKQFMINGAAMVHVIDPDDFEKVFRAEGKYPRRPPMDIWVEHRKRRNHFPGVFMSEGEEWHRIRQTIAPKIMRPKIVEENIDNFNAVAEDAIARFVKLKEGCGPDDHIPDLEWEISKWSTESIGTLAFDARLGLYEDPPKQEALKFIEEVQNFFRLSHKLMFSIPSTIARKYVDTPTFKKFLECGDTVLDLGQSFVDRKMKELKEMTEKGIDPSANAQVVPLLTYLLTKEELTPMEVNGHAIDVVAAAVDNTSNSVLWWLYNLARFPHIQEKLYQEVENVVGKDGEITAKSIAKLRFLKACLKESMRLTPVTVGLARIMDQDVVLSGYNVPAQTWVIMELYCTARSEKYFKDPLEFKPERWLRENKDENHAFSNLPFGFGTRMCAGRRVAELEMYVFICKLLQRFRLEYHHEPLELYQKLITVPDKTVKIKFVDRL